MRAKQPEHAPSIIRAEFNRIVLTDAWKLARSGVNQFGGHVVEYRDQAMCMAWQETKANPRAWATAILAADFAGPR